MQIKRILTGSIPTVSYVISDENEAVIIDPAQRSQKISDYIENNSLKVKFVLLTHAHADHFYGARDFCREYGVCACIGEDEIPLLYDNVNNAALMLGLNDIMPPDNIMGLKDGQSLSLGNIKLEFILTPGHTANSGVYYTPGALFSGDTLFKGSVGRTDLYSGDYDKLIRSIKNKLYTLDDDTVVYSGHSARTTIGSEKQNNPFVKA